jgi:hypothetical protein
MREVRFGTEFADAPDSSYAAMEKEFAQLREQRGRIFRVYSQAGDMPCVLTTTSGQICLELSRLSEAGQHHLCVILVNESEKDESGEGLLVSFFKPRRAIFVTPFHRNKSGYIFHLSATADHHDDGHDGHGH